MSIPCCSYIVTSSAQAIEKVFDSSIDLRKTIILEQEINRSSLASGEAKVINYSPNEVEIETSSLGPSLLFLSDTYYPG